MSLRTRRNLLLTASVGIVVFVILMIVAAHKSLPSSSATPPLSPRPTSSVLGGQIATFQPQVCGQLKTDVVKIGTAASSVSRQVATFYPWGCPTKDQGCTYTGNGTAYPDPACDQVPFMTLPAIQTPPVTTKRLIWPLYVRARRTGAVMSQRALRPQRSPVIA